jgi:flagellar biosynthetic protein FliP
MAATLMHLGRILSCRSIVTVLLAALALGGSGLALAATPPSIGDVAGLVGNSAKAPEFSTAMRILIMLTLLSMIPALLIATTAFLRIIIVLSMLRHAIGMQDTPPNAALIVLAMFLTLFSMQPVLNAVDRAAWQPYQRHQLGAEDAFKAGLLPIREFMVRQTRESDLALMVEMSHSPQPETIDDIGTLQLIPAFMLSELRTAFQIGFMIFLPFLLVDLLVASVLTSLGMMMVPPVMISLPIKVLMFILIDGWNLVTRALLASFH